MHRVDIWCTRVREVPFACVSGSSRESWKCKCGSHPPFSWRLLCLGLVASLFFDQFFRKLGGLVIGTSNLSDIGCLFIRYQRKETTHRIIIITFRQTSAWMQERTWSRFILSIGMTNRKSLKPHFRVMPVSLATLIICSDSEIVRVIGFSQSTCFPVWRWESVENTEHPAPVEPWISRPGYRDVTFDEMKESYEEQVREDS